MRCVSVEQNGATQFANLLRSSVVNVGGRVIANARMDVVFVIPSHEALGVGVSVFKTAEAIGKVRTVFEGAELTF